MRAICTCEKRDAEKFSSRLTRRRLPKISKFEVRIAMRSLEDRIFSRHWEHAGASLEPAHGHATRARLRYARAMVRSLHISSLNTTRCVLCALRPPRHSAAATLAPPLIRHEDVVCGPRRHLAPTRIDSTHNRKHFARICAKEIVISSHATITGLRTRTEKDLRA